MLVATGTVPLRAENHSYDGDAWLGILRSSTTQSLAAPACLDVFDLRACHSSISLWVHRLVCQFPITISTSCGAALIRWAPARCCHEEAAARPSSVPGIQSSSSPAPAQLQHRGRGGMEDGDCSPWLPSEPPVFPARSSLSAAELSSTRWLSTVIWIGNRLAACTGIVHHGCPHHRKHQLFSCTGSTVWLTFGNTTTVLAPV